MEHLSKQVEQLQQMAEKDRESYELLCYHALEVERQKWEAREARLTAKLDKAMQQIAALQEQIDMGENVRQPIKKSESLNIPMNTTACNSPAISDVPTNTSST